MFTDFFYKLRQAGLPASPTSFLTLHKALAEGLVRSLDDFYIAARAILVKSERYFDLFDQVFAHCFRDGAMPDPRGLELDGILGEMIAQWLEDPRILADMLGMDETGIRKLSPEALLEYFKARLEDQKGRHDGGSRWIGTGGTSPAGNSGYHPEGLRVGGISRNRSAVKVALERRYKDYAGDRPLTSAMTGEALKRLRNMVPAGPKDLVDVDESVYRTMKNGGEIEIVFGRRLKDRIKVILAIDNGGWSMDPHVPVVRTLFDHARAQFDELKIFFFHNTIYDTLWEDPARFHKPVKVDDLARFDPEARLVLVGDASMAPYELMARDGSIHIEARSAKPSIERLSFLAQTFPHCVWLNPVPSKLWRYIPTIQTISRIFPMFELSLDGLEKAVSRLMAS